MQAFPAAQTTLADTAAWAQEATACLDELAALDLSAAASAEGLSVPAWLMLSVARRSNVLRHWLRGQFRHPAPASLVSRLMEELGGARQGRWEHERGRLRLHRGILSWTPAADEPLRRGDREASLCLRRAGRHALPGWGGHLVVSRVGEGGVPLAWLGHVELRARSGGEQFQAGIGRPPRSLKKQYQAQGVPAWERDGPLLYSGGQLVFVPGLGLDARVIGLPGQPLVSLRWEPSAAG